MHKMILRVVQAISLIGLTVLALPVAVKAQNGAGKLFNANCAMCHGADGSGNAPAGKALGAKDLMSGEVQKKTDDELIGLISTGQGKMPAFGKKIDPQNIRLLVAYIRALPKKK